MKRAIEDSLSLLAGAGVGLAVMYLLDPQSGPRRRQRLADAARDTVEGAGQTLSSAARSARDAASHFSDTGQTFAQRARQTARNAASQISDWSSNIGSAASDWSDSASSWRDAASKQIKRFSDKASDYAPSAGSMSSIGSNLADRAKSLLPDMRHQWKSIRRGAGRASKRAASATGSSNLRRAAQPAGYAAGGLGLVVLGAGLAYLFDPSRGRARRALLRDQAYSIANDAGDFMWRFGRRVSNRARGTYARGRSMFQSEQIDDERLRERIRSAMGHIHSAARLIDVMVTDGHVTLRCGRGMPSLSQDVIDPIVAGVSSVRGVRSVDCQVTPAQSASGSQRNESQAQQSDQGSQSASPANAI